MTHQIKIPGTFVLLFLVSLLPAQEVDTTYIRLIKEYTTDRRFFPNSFENFQKSQDLPSPLEYFGTIIGAPGVMHHTEDIYSYYRELAENSPRLEMHEIMKSEEGRPINLLVISSEENLSRINQNKSNMGQLADPRKVNSSDLSRLINTTKPVYYLNGGLHSTEMGSPEMLMELTFRLITDEGDDIKKIREEVIVLINPVSEPDGRDKQVDWYYRYSKQREHIDDGFPRSPPYWGKYVFHDNNRDGLQISQALTKAIFNTYFEWHPLVMLDLHESVPLLYISTGTGPYNTYVDPITIGEWQTLANHDLTQVTSEGLPGVFTWAFYNGWWPGYAIWVANNHNAIGRFYETFGNAGANTYMRDLTERRYAGDFAHTRQWYRPEPPTKKVLWSARNNINYMEAGVLASLTYAANNGKQMLRNFYRRGFNNINKWQNGGNFAYVISADQRDPNMTAYLVNQLIRQGIEVHKRNSGENAGEYVVMLDQPYSGFAEALLSRQNYPKDAKHNPYDDIAWTYGLMYGVDVIQLKDSSGFQEEGLELVESSVIYNGQISGSGNSVIINYKAQNEIPGLLYDLSENRKIKLSIFEEQLKTQVEIKKEDTSYVVSRDSLNAGSIFIEGAGSNEIQKIINEGLDIIKSNSKPEVQLSEINLPRIAIYHSWYFTQAEGWVRFTFENRGIPYTSIDKDDLKLGDLSKRFDVILLPHNRGSVETMIHGVDSKWGPMPYTRTEQYPHHGYPDATNDMTGGPGFDGIDNLKSFIEQGGTLITLGNATRMAAETGITRALSPYSAGGLFHPGSIVTTMARNPDHFIMNGYEDTTHVFRGNLRLYQVGKYDRNYIVMQYGTGKFQDEKVYTGKILGMPDYEPDSAALAQSKIKPTVSYVLSGMVKNEDKINAQGAIFDIPVGDGRVIAFTFNPLHRFLNHHDASFVWNAIINWDK